MDASAIMMARTKEEIHAAAMRMQLFLPDQLTRRALAEQLLAAYRGQVRGLLPRFLTMDCWDALHACRGHVAADGHLMLPEKDRSGDLEDACLLAQTLGLAFCGKSGVFLSPLLLDCAEEAMRIRPEIEAWNARVEQLQGVLQYHGMLEAKEMLRLCREQLGMAADLRETDVILYLSSREDATQFLRAEGRMGWFVSPDLELPEDLLEDLADKAQRKLTRAVYTAEEYAAAGRLGYPDALPETQELLRELTQVWGFEAERSKLMVELTFSAMENEGSMDGAESLLVDEVESKRGRSMSLMEKRHLHVAAEAFFRAMPSWRRKGHALREKDAPPQLGRVLRFPGGEAE